MTDPATFPVAPSAATAVSRATPVPPAPASTQPATEPKAPAASAAREPIQVDVVRGDSGVFVYTLRDPATDTVLAVIPWELVQGDDQGRNLDQKV